jgi:hypothetical protein
MNGPWPGDEVEPWPIERIQALPGASFVVNGATLATSRPLRRLSRYWAPVKGRAAPITSSGFCRSIGLSVLRTSTITRERGLLVHRCLLNSSSNFDEDQEHSA